MLGKTIKSRRQQKGLTQEELAVRLHVVRQTVSKWESGLSVPDARMLIELARELDTTAGFLLGESTLPDSGEDLYRLEEKLERANAALAEKNAKSRKRMRTAAVLMITAAALWVIILLIPSIHLLVTLWTMDATVGMIGGADGPTAIFVTAGTPRILRTGLRIAGIAALAAVGIVLLRKNRK